MDELAEWIGLATAQDYLEGRFSKMHTHAIPAKETVRRWFKRGLIKTHPRRTPRALWFTTYDWLDEAIMWKRIPPKKNRPPVAMIIDRDDYIATQESLL